MKNEISPYISDPGKEVAASGYRREFFFTIRDHLVSVGGGVVVEIGTRMGAWMLDLMFHTAHVDHAYAIDPWPARSRRGLYDVLPKWLAVLRPWAFKTVTPLRGRSQDWGRILDIRPDVIYVDGSHRYRDVLEDITVWWPKLKPGGLMFLHDANEMDVHRAAVDFWPPNSPRDHNVLLRRWGPREITTLQWTKLNGEEDSRCQS
jgi:hypothetical protein